MNAIRFCERHGLLLRPPRTEEGLRRYAQNAERGWPFLCDDANLHYRGSCAEATPWRLFLPGRGSLGDCGRDLCILSLTRASKTEIAWSMA
jgi:hypothetical protein